MQTPNWVLFSSLSSVNTTSVAQVADKCISCYLIYFQYNTNKKRCVCALSMVDISQLFESFRYFNFILRDSSQFVLFSLHVVSPRRPPRTAPPPHSLLHIPPGIWVSRDFIVQGHYSLQLCLLFVSYWDRLQFYCQDTIFKNLSTLMNHLHVRHVRHDVRRREELGVFFCIQLVFSSAFEMRLRRTYPSTQKMKNY